MKKVTVTKDSILLCSGIYEEGQEFDSWLERRIAQNTFGLPERPELILDEATGEMIPTGNILPAEYEIVIEDITAQVEQERINAEALAFLASTDWLIIRELDAGIPCPTEIKIARQEARQRIVR